ncbi:ATP-grasp domain-containing protein [Paenibacillus borealis]|uniref:Phosphoribosylglycinamide synthetase n=1 Tax=Paenibacillus borealis TaxID=160799 RepID=A0A089LG24_PAEBO|nr:ATP-grasp domain-containing protein [Paenibacillus borealis]AIQ60431.1 phosphoribosylglycinamide synthetase [Paenibacillus borealis]
MKRVLFINLRSHKVERMEPLYAARNLNVKVTLLADKKPGVDEGFIDDYIITDTYDMKACLEIVKEYAAKTKIHGVVTWADKDVELASLIGEALQLKTLSIAASTGARNKFEMRKKIESVFPELCPQFRQVRTWEDLMSAQAEIGFPAIFKPVGASGSKSIFKVNAESDLPDIYRSMVETTRIEKDKVYSYYPSEYIYEEFLEGDEISIEGLIDQGQIIIAGIIDKYVTEDYSLEYKEIFPSQKNSEDLKQYQIQIKQALTALQFDNCAFHAECKVKGSKLKVIEIAARPAGGFITSHLIPIVTGISFHEEVINNAVGEAVNQDMDMVVWQNNVPSNVVLGHLDLLSQQAGVVTQIAGIEDVFEDKNILYFLPTASVNQQVSLPPDSFGSLYLATCIAKGTSISEVEYSMAKAMQKYKVTIE